MSGNIIFGIKINGDSSSVKKALDEAQRVHDRYVLALKKPIGEIASLKALRADLGSTDKALTEAKRKLDFFKTSASIGGSAGAKAYARDIAAASKEVINLAQKAAQQRTAIGGLEQSLRAAGIDTARLSAAQAKLNSEMSAANMTLNTRRAALPDPTTEMRKGISLTKEAVNELQARLVGAFAVSSVINFVRTTTQEFSKAESAYRGLEAVANSSGLGIGKALDAANRIAADGLVTTADASKALQNLLSRGYSLDQAVDTLTRLKDAAAFNRAAHLSLSEAVLTASEGLKNENSILVDNAGVTKNVSVIWQEYADAIGKSVNDLTQQEKIQAEVGGIMRETAAQTGNAAEAAKALQGEQARLDASTIKLKASIGQALVPAMKGLVAAGQFAITYFFKPVILGAQGIGIAAGAAGASLSAMYTLLKTRDMGAFSKEIENIRAQAKQMQAENVAALSKDALNFTPRVQAEGSVNTKLVNLTQQRTAKITALEKEQVEATKKLRADSIKESISGYDRLANAIRGALDKSLSDEKNYLQRAKELRAEANAQPKDPSYEGQASATLDLLAAEAKLQRLRSDSGGSLEDVQAQAKSVRDLAANIDDQTRAREALKAANLAEADAFDKAAAAEKTQQAGLQQQYEKTIADVAKLKADLASLTTEDKTVPIKADIADIDTKIAEIKAKLAELAKGVDVPIRYTAPGGTPPGAAPPSVPKQGLATGGVVRGPGSETSDSIPIWASRNEFMHNAAAHKFWGTDFMQAINRRDMGSVIARMRPQLKLAGGGPVSLASRVSLPGAASPAASGSALTPINLTLPGIGNYAMQAPPDVAAELTRAVSRMALKMGKR